MVWRGTIDAAPKGVSCASSRRTDIGVAVVAVDSPGVEDSLVVDQLVLVNGTRAYWLEMFAGKEADLDLALRQVRGTVNAGSRKSLKAQVEAGLARIAADQRQRRENYLDAARRNEAARQRSGTTVRGVF